MSKTTRGMQSIGAGVLGLALAVLPATALGLEDEATGGPAAPPSPVCAMLPPQPFNSPLLAQVEVMEGAPYSGVGTTEVVTTLADGNRISRTNTMRYFRDSAGRTRTEYQLAAIGPFVPEEAQQIVTIADPVAGRQFVLHPHARRADALELRQGEAGVPAVRAIVVGSALTNVNSGLRQPEIGTRASLVQSARSARARIGMPRPGGGRQAPSMLAPGFTQGRSPANPGAPADLSAAGTAQATVAAPVPLDVLIVNGEPALPGCKGGEAAAAAKPVSIGERRIEGLKVVGSRLEYTVEAGAVGNEQPITVRTDQWFSPDLGVVVSSTVHDPMIGESTYRLEQISRAEPDPSLFVVPEDYEVVSTARTRE